MRRDSKKRIQPIRALAGVLLYVTVISAVLLSPGTAFAADPAALEQQKSETEAKQKDAEARKKDAKEDLGTLQNEQKSLEQNVSGISDSIDSVEAEIAEAESNVQAASRDIESLSADLSDAEQREASARTQMKAQIQADYERSRSGGFLSILLGSTSMADFLNRANYASALAEQSRKLVDSYVELQHTIREKSDSLSARQADLASQQATLTAKRDELNTMLGSATDALSAKNVEVADASSDLDAIDQEISGYKAEITSLEAGIADANAALAQQIAEQQAAAEAAAKAAQQKAAEEAANSKTLDEDAAAKEAAAKAAAEEAARAKAAQEADAAAKQQAAEQAAAEAEAARKAAEEAAKKAAEAQQQADAAAEASSIPSSAGKVYSTDAGDIALLSALCQAEAGNQGYNGLLAVASVVMNRVFYKGGGFPNTLSGVIYQKNQFEPNTRKMVVRQDGKWVKLDETVLEYYLSHPEAVSDDAKNAAAAALSGTRYQNGGADMNQLFFMTPAALDKQTWLKSRTLKDKFVLGGHAFFNVI